MSFSPQSRYRSIDHLDIIEECEITDIQKDDYNIVEQLPTQEFFDDSCVENMAYNDPQSALSLVSPSNTNLKRDNEILIADKSLGCRYDYRMNKLCNLNESARKLEKEKPQLLSIEKVEIIPKSAIQFGTKQNQVPNSDSKEALIPISHQHIQQPQQQSQIILAQYFDMGNCRYFVIPLPQEQAADSIIEHPKVLSKLNAENKDVNTDMNENIKENICVEGYNIERGTSNTKAESETSNKIFIDDQMADVQKTRISNELYSQIKLQKQIEIMKWKNRE